MHNNSNTMSGRFMFISHWNIKPKKKKNSGSSIQNKFISATNKQQLMNGFEGSIKCTRLSMKQFLISYNTWAMPLTKTVMHINHYFILLPRCRHSKCVQECGKQGIMIWWCIIVWNRSQWICFRCSKQPVPRNKLQVAFGYLLVTLILNAATKNNNHTH